MLSTEASPDLLRRLTARDTEALGELYDRYSHLLFGLIFRILRDRGEAEDVLQEVFVQAWSRASSYDAALGPPVAWLLGIARNRSIDRLRAKATRERTLEGVPIPAASVETPESITGATERQRQIHRAFDTLPTEERDLIERAYFLGSTQAEMAAQLKLPLGTVKTRIRTGLTRLRSLLHTLVEQ
jgi:RNA polymerase sigma-70 factor (ECF subfamily)